MQATERDTKPEIVYWTTIDEFDVPAHEDLDEAIAGWLDEGNGEPGNYEPSVTVYGWRREASEAQIGGACVADMIVETLDDEYGGGTRDPHEHPDRTLKAAEALIESIRVQYCPYVYAVAEERTIDVEAWLREHRPGWVE